MSDAARKFCRRVADILDRNQLAEQADLLRVATDTSVDTAVSVPRSGDRPHAVAQRYYGDALALARNSEAGDLAGALSRISERLVWTQTDTYVRSPPHGHFLDRYAHATVLGSSATAILIDDTRTAAVGVLLIGAHNEYPHHRHYADEVYLPVTPARWSSALDAPYCELSAGACLHHHTLQPHSVHTDDTSLLAVYVWTGDTTTSARLC